MGVITDKLLQPAGDPQPGVPGSEAVGRKLGLDSPLGKTSYYAQFKSSHSPVKAEQGAGIYPMLYQEMVSKLAEK